MLDNEKQHSVVVVDVVYNFSLAIFLFSNLLFDLEWQFLLAAAVVVHREIAVGPVAEAWRGRQLEELGLLAVHLGALNDRVEAWLFANIWNKKVFKITIVYFVFDLFFNGIKKLTIVHFNLC